MERSKLDYQPGIEPPSTNVLPMKSFVILYTSREGSSAIISKLAKHQEVHVAGFEDMDLRNVRKTVGDPLESVGSVITAVLQYGKIPGVESTYNGEKVLGFKWRAFGGDAAVEALRSHDTTVIYLYRRNTLRRALSMLYTGGHVQFEFAAMTDEDRHMATTEIRSRTFTADPAEVAERIRRYTYAKKRIWDVYTKSLPHMFLEYEFFNRDPVGALNEILARLDLSPFQCEPDSRFVKTMRDDIESQCGNLSEVLGDPSVVAAIQKFENFLEAREL